MCYDQEKTQAAEPNKFDPRHEARLKSRFADMETAGCAVRAMSDSEILAELFKYHPPTGETLPKYAAINQAAKNLAEVILQNCPPSADRSAAIRLIRDARMTANASVALNGLSL
jgi:hypothetical protein